MYDNFTYFKNIQEIAFYRREMHETYQQVMAWMAGGIFEFDKCPPVENIVYSKIDLRTLLTFQFPYGFVHYIVYSEYPLTFH